MAQLKQKHVDNSSYQKWMFAEILKYVCDIHFNVVGHIPYV